MNLNDGDQQDKKSMQVVQRDLIEVKRTQRSNTERIGKLEGKTDIANVVIRIIVAVIVSTIITMILISVTT